MATKCEIYQTNIKNFESAVANTTADFNSKKATAQAWISSFDKDFARSCGRDVTFSNNVNFYVTGGQLSAGSCKIGIGCSKSGCEGRINNDINPSLLAMQSAGAAMNKAIADLATEKNNFNNDPECKAQQQTQTQSGAEILIRDTEANRKLRNNIIIVIVVVIIVAISIWAWRKYKK